MITIFIVEDEYFVRRGLVLTVPWDELGCQVIGEAEDGFQGLNLILKLRPDIVISDIRMPGIDGLEMIRRVQETLDCEFIIISGYNEFQYAKEAVKLGVRDYLLKPIDDHELLEVIRKVSAAVRDKERLETLKGIELLNDGKAMLFKEFTAEQFISTQENYILEAVNYIKAHYRREINMKEVADHLNISESYLSRLFKQETNYTFVEYLTNYRIKKAIELLRTKKDKIYEVALMVGYSDYRYFSTVFKKLVGITPTEFKDGLA